MKRTALILAAFALAIPSAGLLAQEAPIEERQALMEDNSDKLGIAGDMVKGETDWDGAAAASAMAGIAANAEELDGLFPEGTHTGSDTRALPIIWEEKDDFDQWLAQLHERAMAAEAAAAGGLDEFRPAFTQVLDTCGGCHDKFRAPE